MKSKRIWDDVIHPRSIQLLEKTTRPIIGLVWRKRQWSKSDPFFPGDPLCPGGPLIRTCWFKHSSTRSATFVRPYATIMNMWTVRLKYVKIKNKIRVWEARPFLKNYIILNKICISLSMCQENDYNRVVLRNY